jgi:hypothetical protein
MMEATFPVAARWRVDGGVKVESRRKTHVNHSLFTEATATLFAHREGRYLKEYQTRHSCRPSNYFQGK